MLPPSIRDDIEDMDFEEKKRLFHNLGNDLRDMVSDDDPDGSDSGHVIGTPPGGGVPLRTPQTRRSIVTPPETHEHDVRNYKCPNCEGEFNMWDKGDWVGRRRRGKRCPFCGIQKGEYDPDE